MAGPFEDRAPASGWDGIPQDLAENDRLLAHDVVDLDDLLMEIETFFSVEVKSKGITLGQR